MDLVLYHFASIPWENLMAVGIALNALIPFLGDSMSNSDKNS